MPIVARSTPMFRRAPINYVPKFSRRAFLAAALATPAAARVIVMPRQRGLGDCVPGQPSTDPNCFTTPAYIRALNLKQDTSEQAQRLLPAGDDAACYDQYMTQGPNFNPDAYNRCIGAQNVTSAAFNFAAASGVPFASNPYQSVVAVAAPPKDATPPPKPPAQSNAPAPTTVGGGSGSSNAPAPVTVAPDMLGTLKNLVTESSFDGVPNWALGIGAVGLAWMVFGRKGR